MDEARSNIQNAVAMLRNALYVLFAICTTSKNELENC